MRDEAAASLRALNETVERLRAPGGCPWDREQTHRTLRPYLLEETYEALEAIESGREPQLREELGDLLLQVLMHCAIAQERADGFDIGDVAETTRLKMVHRHPHVFGDVAVEGAEEVVVNWERLKAREKGERLSVLDGVPRTLPSLAYALGLQKRPARLGFDLTPAVDDAVEMLLSAVAAVRDRAGAAASPARGADWVVDEATTADSPQAEGALHGVEEAEEEADAEAAPAPPPGAHSAGPPPAPTELEDAVGELLFAAVALSRRLRVNPEDALRRRAERFAERFRALEATARTEGTNLHDLPGDDWTRRWAETPGS